MDYGGFISTLRSQQTRRSYRWMLDRVSRWLISINLSFEDLTLDVLINYMDTQAWGANTRYQAFCACKSYLKWLLKSKSPLADAKLKRPRPRLQRTLSRLAASTLLSSIDTSTPYGRRNLAMIILMINTGLRSFEVCGILLRDLDLKSRHLQVLCKGGIWQIKRFSPYTAACIQSWLGVRSDWSKAHPMAQTLFTTDEGRKIPTNTLRRLFSRLGIKIDMELSPHDLRRTFATVSTQAGAPPRIVMAAGGWTSQESFLRYTQAIGLDDIDPFDPVDYIMGKLN